MRQEVLHLLSAYRSTGILELWLVMIYLLSASN